MTHHTDRLAELGAHWTFTTVLYISPLTNAELAGATVRELHAYVLDALTRINRHDAAPELHRAELGLKRIVAGGYRMLEHHRYQVASTRAVAILATRLASLQRTDGHPARHPIETVPDAAWPN